MPFIASFMGVGDLYKRTTVKKKRKPSSHQELVINVQATVRGPPQNQARFGIWGKAVPYAQTHGLQERQT